MERLLPAYPLFVKDPYFSIWAQTEKLNEENVIFWTGDEKKIYGYLKTEEGVFCFLGKSKDCKPAEQISLSLTAFTTDYAFRAGKAELKISFVSPLPPDNLKLLSCPVCYVNYEVTGVDNAEVIFAVEQSICSNGGDLPVRGGTAQNAGYQTAFFGLRRQMALSVDSDRVGAEWGHWYLTGERAYCASEQDFFNYLSSGAQPQSSKGASPKYLVSSSRSLSGKVLLAFDDTVSVNYFGDLLKGYYLDESAVTQAIEETFLTSKQIDKYLSDFDKKLETSAKEYGEEYLNILYASLRQSVGAHKLVKDRSGNLLFLSKECCSNGCMATVDVSYPSIPLYLLYNPELVRAMLRPIFRFAKMPVWKYDFAPHDAGTYPNCCGQVYGMYSHTDERLCDLHDTLENETRFPYYLLPATAEIYDFNFQMPVEECANMLVMLAAAHKADGSPAILGEEFGLLEKWADYLVRYGLKPDNQLCTDDFSGHLKNNITLAIKAAVGLGCFAEICKFLGKKEKCEKYANIAREFAAEITAFSDKFGHLPLTWDGDGETYSLKYNLAFDKILGLNLFPESLYESEVNYYLTKLNAYGVPLDTRAEFTKSDWLMWAASLTADKAKIRALTGSLNAFLKQGKDRLPFGDWYETKSGSAYGFRNRTVQGGCFILLLPRQGK